MKTPVVFCLNRTELQRVLRFAPILCDTGFQHYSTVQHLWMPVKWTAYTSEDINELLDILRKVMAACHLQ